MHTNRENRRGRHGIGLGGMGQLIPDVSLIDIHSWRGWSLVSLGQIEWLTCACQILKSSRL
jgi:hypothetical protein